MKSKSLHLLGQNSCQLLVTRLSIHWEGPPCGCKACSRRPVMAHFTILWLLLNIDRHANDSLTFKVVTGTVTLAVSFLFALNAKKAACAPISHLYQGLSPGEVLQAFSTINDNAQRRSKTILCCLRGDQSVPSAYKGCACMLPQTDRLRRSS